MTQRGYTMMTEQALPDQLVRNLRAAEEVGFGFSVSSGHHQPWPVLLSVEEHATKVEPFLDAGFTGIALVQTGAGQQEPFFEWVRDELLPAPREL